jgi:hypothetical protein
VNEISECLGKVINLFTWKAKERRVNVGLEVVPSTPELIEFDEGRLT